MKDFSIAMALVDYIPVAFFGLAIVLLLQDLYKQMSKGAFALFAAGGVNVFAAGALKATYKLLYAANICDFTPLNTLFMPVQSLGFLMAGAGLLMMVCGRKKHLRAAAVPPPVFTGTFLFIGLMVAGLGLMSGALIYVAMKMRKPLAAMLFGLCFVCCLCMGYLSSQDFALAAMNWLAEGINTVGQGALLLGAWTLHKAGLASWELPAKSK